VTYYARSSYGSTNPNAGYPANGNWAAWGGYAYPNCPPSSLTGTTSYVSAATGGQKIAVSLRKELVPLWDLAFQICDVKWGYPTWANRNGENWGPWGGQCRAISGTSNPSGHSAWLSVDINAPYNPYSYTFQSDMPPGMVADLESLFLYWGGRYQGQKYDPMHWGYCRTPADVPAAIKRAESILGSTPTPPEDDMTPDECRAVVRDELAKFFSSDTVTMDNDEMSTPSSYKITRDAMLERGTRLTSLVAARITNRDGKLPQWWDTAVVKVTQDEMSTPADYNSNRDDMLARILRLTSIATAHITGRDGKAPVPPK
jgi:hypothetical protein